MAFLNFLKPKIKQLSEKFNIAAETHIGLIRKRNEDCYFFLNNPVGANFPVAVCDGIGGHEQGDFASRECIVALLKLWKIDELSSSGNIKKVASIVNKKLYEVNGKINFINCSKNYSNPMGTTLVLGIFFADKLLLIHSGDSRCYKISNGEISRLTEDHSVVANLLRRRVIDEQEARSHPLSHVISKSIGPTKKLEIEARLFDRQKGDCYLFCTDGLTNHVNDTEIEAVVNNAASAEAASKSLIKCALKSGGEDNVTVVCVFPEK